MATTFTLQSTSYDGRYLLLTCTQTQNIAGNYSTVDWTLESLGGDNNYYSTGATTVTINGSEVYYCERKSYSTKQFPAAKGSTSGKITIYHNSDGSKSVSVSLSTAIYTSTVTTKDGTWVLDTNPRKATITSAPNFTDEENPVLKYSNPAGEAVTSLKACISLTGSVDDIKYRDISKTGSSYTFNLTEAERNVLRNATTGNSRTVYFYLWTVIGGVDYRVPDDVTFSIANANPIITPSVIDVNPDTVALTGDSSKLVKFYSDAQATMTAVAQKGASIDESLYIIRNGDNTGYGDSYTFNNVENNVFTFSAEDSRGNIGQKTVAPTMVNYVKLTCNIENTKPDAVGNMDVRCTGSYFNGSFGAVSNTLTVKCRYKDQNGSYGDWYSMTVTKNGNYYGAYTSFTIPDFDYQAVYTFECQATDKLETVSSIPNPAKSTPVFHWGENDFVFEVPVTFNAGVNNSAATSTTSSDQTIDGDLNVTGDLRLKGSGNYGNKLRFGDGDYCYINEPSDDVMTIHAKQINLDTTNGVYLGSSQIPNLYTGSWTPSLNSSAISSYSSKSGWYAKIGQVVVVGFYVKANCRSGYDSTLVTIGGLPYIPSVAASGGGMCSGTHVSAGLNFQCYVAETSGTITTRVQSCNNTTATSLSTSASSPSPRARSTRSSG